jgi:quinol monooxygenase YgiN
MILITVKIKAKPGQAGALVSLLKEMAQVGRTEPGTVAYEPYVSAEDPDTLFMFELYRDHAALAEHRANTGLDPFRARFKDLLGGAPEIHNWTEAG